MKSSYQTAEIYQWTPNTITIERLVLWGYSLIHDVYMYMVLSFVSQVANQMMKYNNMRIAKTRCGHSSEIVSNWG